MTTTTGGDNEDEAAIATVLQRHGHELVKLSVISSTQISPRVATVLEKLGNHEHQTADPKPAPIVSLTAKSKVASKLVSIVEIAKRELTKKGLPCFQYNALSSTTIELPRTQVEAGSEDVSEGENAFEPLKPKIRNVPVLTVYLAHGSVRELKARYGYVTL